MKQLVIMPGGFHPFHAGHLALYQAAKQAFPGADVKVAATNDTSQRPFPFKIKEKLAQLAGVKPGDFYQVKSPFRAEEITKNYNPEDTELIFVRSEKDATKPPQAGGVKKNGEPAYLQPLAGQDTLSPMNQHAYMAYLPTVEFGPGMTSATEIRTAWPQLNHKRKTALVMSLYPKTQSNPKLADTGVKMLDTAIDGGNEVDETRIINPKRIDVFYRPVLGSRGKRVVAQNVPATALDALLAKLSSKFGVRDSDFEWTAADQKVSEDYLDEKWSQKYKRSINCAHPKGFSQKAHCAGRKK
jgi:Cytidylyltransferase-like